MRCKWFLFVRTSLMRKLNKFNVITHLNSSVSVISSCSIARKTWTISAMMMGQSEVTWSGESLRSSTRKHRKTAAWTEGTIWGRRRLFASCSIDQKFVWNLDSSSHLKTVFSYLEFRACICDTGQTHCRIWQTRVASKASLVVRILVLWTRKCLSHRFDSVRHGLKIRWLSFLVFCRKAGGKYLLIRSLNAVILSKVIRLSKIVFQNGRQLPSIWKKAASVSKSRTSLRHALRVFWKVSIRFTKSSDQYLSKIKLSHSKERKLVMSNSTKNEF